MNNFIKVPNDIIKNSLELPKLFITYMSIIEGTNLRGYSKFTLNELCVLWGYSSVQGKRSAINKFKDSVEDLIVRQIFTIDDGNFGQRLTGGGSMTKQKFLPNELIRVKIGEGSLPKNITKDYSNISAEAIKRIIKMCNKNNTYDITQAINIYGLLCSESRVENGIRSCEVWKKGRGWCIKGIGEYAFKKYCKGLEKAQVIYLEQGDDLSIKNIKYIIEEL